MVCRAKPRFQGSKGWPGRTATALPVSRPNDGHRFAIDGQHESSTPSQPPLQIDQGGHAFRSPLLGAEMERVGGGWVPEVKHGPTARETRASEPHKARIARIRGRLRWQYSHIATRSAGCRRDRSLCEHEVQGVRYTTRSCPWDCKLYAQQATVRNPLTVGVRTHARPRAILLQATTSRARARLGQRAPTRRPLPVGST